MTTAAKIEAAMAVGLAEYERAIQFDDGKGANSIADSVGTLACALAIVRDNGDGGVANILRTGAPIPLPDEEEHEG